MMRIRNTLMTTMAGSACLVALAVSASAHHAFNAEFDAKRPLVLKGKVVKVELFNPHAWIHVEVSECSGSVTKCVNPDGTKQVWMVEGGTPNTLLRRGFTKESLPYGTEIIVEGYQAKDGSTRANGRDLTFPDGRKLFLGSSGTGAPSDSAPK
jgi:hypothetical protein